MQPEPLSTEMIEAWERLEAGHALRSYRFIGELADTWRGLALLRCQRPEAVDVLRRAVRSMVAGDRILELPRAAAYLAEAEWRAGNEDASEEAARLALEAAERLGSTDRLLQALEDVPAVAARGIDAESDRAARWHELGRVLISDAGGAAHSSAAQVELHDLGRLEIVVDGATVRTRIRKSAEMLAFLVTEGKPSVPRRKLLHALFDGRDDRSTRAYIRQAMHQLRGVLPASAGLTITRDELQIAGIAAVTADSLRFERLLAQANRQGGEERLASLQRALEAVHEGGYLPEVESDWARERRQLLDDAIHDARVATAELLFQHGRYKDASRIVGDAVKNNPYSERAWRLRIKVADAVGDDDRMLDAYRRCCTHLSEIGLGPSAETVGLVERLRV